MRLRSKRSSIHTEVFAPSRTAAKFSFTDFVEYAPLVPREENPVFNNEAIIGSVVAWARIIYLGFSRGYVVRVGLRLEIGILSISWIDNTSLAKTALLAC